MKIATRKFNVKPLAFLICGLLTANMAFSQAAVLGASYYQNQYLSNPAFAGISAGGKINLHYRSAAQNVLNSPVNYTLTGVYGTDNKHSGFGFVATADKAGLIANTRIYGTYAYHLTLNNTGSMLHFGVSAGYARTTISAGGINADYADIAIADYNNQPASADGDFGVAFTNDQLTLQAAVLGINSFLKRNGIRANNGYIYAAAGLKLFKNGGTQGYNLEPKVGFRRSSADANVFDAGVELSLDLNVNKAKAIFMYHSTNSLTAGMELLLNSKLDILVNYNVQKVQAGSYENGALEVGFGIKF